MKTFNEFVAESTSSHRKLETVASKYLKNTESGAAKAAFVKALFDYSVEAGAAKDQFTEEWVYEFVANTTDIKNGKELVKYFIQSLNNDIEDLR